MEVVRELLNHGPTVDITNINDLTPLKTAASKGNFGVFGELLNHGASVDIAKRIFHTSEHNSLQWPRGRYPRIVSCDAGNNKAKLLGSLS